MAFGGGIWTSQNKILPGTYINFSSVAKASATLSDRGVAALPIPLTWGLEGDTFEVDSGDFQKNSMSIFGYAYTDPAMLALRELYKGAKTAILYRLSGTTTKATCQISGTTVATAKYGGSRGNALIMTIAVNIDDPAAFDVLLYMDGMLVEEWIGITDENVLKDSAFITITSDFTFTPTAGSPFTGGSNGTVTGLAHQEALDRLESRTFNTLGCVAEDDITKSLYVSYTKRMRDEVGAKFQMVGWQIPNADYEGVISVENTVSDFPENGMSGLVYWVTGMQAGCEVNRSVTNRLYNGELTIDTVHTQKQLEDAVRAGKFIMHRAGSDVRVLDDINTLVTLSDTKGEVFQSNQTIRVCDQIGNDIAVLFNTRYAGIVPNDNNGRMSLWGDICKLIQELERIRAIEDFDTTTLSIEQGNTKKAVLCTISGLNVINAMGQLYMTVSIA